MIATDFSTEKLRALAAALTSLDAQVFAGLFDPLVGRGFTVRPAPSEQETFQILRAAGLVQGPDDEVRGVHRIRRAGPRFYVMELGGGDAYFQDVWPETDAMLAALDRAKPGRFADVGTGCGIVAVEAAARGHQVVATDLFDSVVALARFNAALNGLDGAIDFRRGHLFEPLAGEKFDLILTAPHYGRVYDQLRLEVLRDGPKHLLPNGRLGLATQLEWAGSGPLAVEYLLKPLARTMRVKVEPIAAPVKRDWFKLARTDGPLPIESRLRFFVSIENVSESSLSLPALPAAGPPEEHFVPLSRLQNGARATAVVHAAPDFAALAKFVAVFASPDFTLDGPLPVALLDACRFGARACLGGEGAARAILDVAGGVRPCSHGGVVARAEDSLAELREKLAALAAAAEARRGCADCAAADFCSRCLFPNPVDEKNYCDFIRAEQRRLPLVHRLFETLPLITPPDAAPPAPLAVRRWPRTDWAVPDEPPDTNEREKKLLRIHTRWNQHETWTLATGETSWLSFRDVHGRLRLRSVGGWVTAVGGQLADDPAPAALAAFVRAQKLPPDLVDRALRFLADAFW